MKEEELLSILVDLARSLQFDVRFDRGSFRDGSCRTQNRKIIVLNRTSPATRKVAALCRVLGDQPLDGVFLLPAVREAIERAKTDIPRPSNGRHHG